MIKVMNRVHRIGQTKETFVHRYLMNNTIEIILHEKRNDRSMNELGVQELKKLVLLSGNLD